MQIQAKQLSKTFRDQDRETTAYRDLTFNVSPGEFFCILGPSGCGKTSLLRTLAGLETPGSGELTIDSRTDQTADIAMVFQEHGLFPWMNLKNNIRFLLENNPHMSGRDLDAICDDYLSRVDLGKFAQHFPHQASGGMRQRVSIARAFANEPNILLMDEPFVFLDYQTRLALQQLLLSIWNETKKTVVFVTHDIEEAVLLADRIMVMSSHPGTIKTFIDIDLPRPRDVLSLQKLPAYHDHVSSILDLLKEESGYFNNQGLDEQMKEDIMT
ncbi:ABC transporter ATP-binding protein [Kaarinaea lacus]